MLNFLLPIQVRLLSQEGTTQGGPESMGFYAASTTPLSVRCHKEGSIKKVFYADDGAGAGKLEGLLLWWKNLAANGPLIGYFPNPKKTWLVVKPGHIERARTLFPDLGQNITAEGHKYLGAFIGSQLATEKFVEEMITDWTKDIDALAKIAKVEPQLAYTAYVVGASKRWQFVTRTTPNISHVMAKLEAQIKNILLPAILGGRSVSDVMRKVYSLPARLGGLGFQNPVVDAQMEYSNSVTMTLQLTNAIFNQDELFTWDSADQTNSTRVVRERKETHLNSLLQTVKGEIPEELSKLVSLSSEKGASIWLTSLPLRQYGFRLNKQQFDDAMCLRYNLQLKDVPRKCICGSDFSIDHCLSCKNGGYIHLRHNSLRDTFHETLTGVCKDVRLEPSILPITGEILPTGSNIQDGARADISALGLWTPLNRAFFDIKVINPLAQSNRSKEIPQMYKEHEEQKKRAYNARIQQVEKGTFTPIVFSCTGGAAIEAKKFVKSLALKLSKKKGEEYSKSVSFLRRRVRFDILRTCLISLRGERHSKHLTAPAVTTPVIDIELDLCEMSITGV